MRIGETVGQVGQVRPLAVLQIEDGVFARDFRYFDFVVDGDDCENTKPDPEPYRRALERVSRPASECLVIEDSERGLLAAKAAGLKCWVIPTELAEGSDFSRADALLGSIGELPERLGHKQRA